jgi:hypothetical protein
MTIQDDVLAKYGVTTAPTAPSGNDILAKYGVKGAPAPTTPPPDDWSLRAMTDRGLAAPGARFLKGATLDTAIGTARMLADHTPGAMAIFNPVGAIAHAADQAVPGNPLSKAYNDYVSAPLKSVEDAANARVAEARANTGRGTGHDWWQTAGELASGALPTPGGKAKLLNEAERVAPTAADLANHYLLSLAGKAQTTPAKIAAAGEGANAGRMMTGAEAAGATIPLTTLGRRSPTVGKDLTALVETRAMTAPGRVKDDLAAAAGIHPDAAQGNIDQLVADGRAAVNPLYKQFYANHVGGLMTDELRGLMQRPAVQRAMQDAATTIRNEGRDPATVGLYFDKQGTLAKEVKPTGEAWDLVKKALGNQVERYPNGTPIPSSISAGNHSINTVNHAIGDALGNADPIYKQALTQSGDYLSLKSAFDRGAKAVLDGKIKPDDLAADLQKLSPAELSAFRGGLANKLYEMAGNTRAGANFKGQVFMTPFVKDKLALVLGKDKAATFLDGLQSELNLAASGSRMKPATNSTTFELSNEAANQDAMRHTMAALHAAHAGANFLTGRLLGGFGRTIQAARHYLPDLTRTQGLTPEAMDYAGQKLMLSPRDLATHLATVAATHMGSPVAPTTFRSFFGNPQISSRFFTTPAIVGTSMYGGQ